MNICRKKPIQYSVFNLVFGQLLSIGCIICPGLKNMGLVHLFFVTSSELTKILSLLKYIIQMQVNGRHHNTFSLLFYIDVLVVD